jgi:hypothetical protein
MINMKRDQMPRPLIGIGHSMGGNHLCDPQPNRLLVPPISSKTDINTASIWHICTRAFSPPSSSSIP